MEATWLSRQVAPGASASLSLTTHGLSLCALTAVDVAARGAAPAPSIKDAVVHRLRRLIEAHRNLTEYDAAGECFLSEFQEFFLRNIITWCLILHISHVLSTSGHM